MTAQDSHAIVDIRNRKRRSTGRLRAILAAVGVLGIGAGVTLAAWTDTEWIFGGSNTDTPIGTSVFEIEQNVYDGQSWQNRENWPTDATAGKLNFTVAATTLTPGSVVYAPVQLRAAPGSTGGTAVLNGAVAGPNTNAALFAALTYQVRTGVTQANCNAAGIGAGTTIVAAGQPLTANGTASFPIGAATNATTAGTPVDVCFQITMPASATSSALQGQTVTPVWNFVATSS